MTIEAIDSLIIKLEQASQPLSIEKQHALATWLRKYLSLHDEKLLTTCFIKLGEEIEATQSKLL